MKRGNKYQTEAFPMLSRAGSNPRAAEPLVHTCYNYEDLMIAAERIRKSAGLDSVSASAAAVGLTLLGSIVLSEKKNPLFDCLRDPLCEFILNMKSPSAHTDEQ
jgi:hypothetical protein